MQKLKNSLVAMLLLYPLISNVGLALAQAGAPATLSESAQAADPTRLAAARDLMKAAKADELYGKIFSGLSGTGSDEITSPILEQIQDPAMRERVRKEVAESQMAMQQELMKQRDGLLDIVAAAYARAFTVEEMEAVTAFHRSRLGAKLNKIALDEQGAAAEMVKAMIQNKPLPKPASADPAKLKAVKVMMEAGGMSGAQNSMFNAPSGSPFAAASNEINDWSAARLANALTLEEMAGITAFFKSPSGSKFVKATPQIMQDVTKATFDKLGGPELKMPSPLPRQ
jgi:hypothetical protein